MAFKINFLNWGLKAFSWTFLEAIDIHNRHDKTGAFRIYDQNTWLQILNRGKYLDQLFL